MLNREACFDATRRLIHRSRDSSAVLAVMILRIRRFREYNIRFGYAFGDQLMAVVAEQLLQALRPMDELIQIGACDFAILLPGLNSAEHATLAAAKLMRLFQDPIAIEGRVVPVNAVVGVALSPEHGTEPDLLFRCAERAYVDARASIDRYAIFYPIAGEADIGHDELHEAISNNRLELHLQAVWDLRSHRLAGVEALSRWHNPRWGWVDPQSFVTLAEQTGLITPLTRWCLNNALHYCAQARRAGLALPFSINLSPRVFGERGIAEQIAGTLRIFDIPPDQVILEVTETTVMDDPALSAQLLGKLRDEGLRIAIDDFGIGHSTFAYLHQIPATELKIDKSFVIEMTQNPRTPRLVQSMITLAGSLELEVVAEGVEDEETMRLLTEMGCDYAQGYYIGRPQPAAAYIDALLAEKSSRG